MPRRNTQDALFPRSSRLLWASGLGYGVLLGTFLTLVATIFNPDLTLLWAIGLTILCIGLSFLPITRRVLTAISSVLGLILLVCVLTPVLRPLEAALDVTEAPVKADVIVALGAGMRCGANQLESASLARVVKALELWRAGYASDITLSDTSGLWNDCPSLADAARGVVARLAPGSAPTINILPNVRNTRDEAEAVAKLAAAKGWKRVLIVTSPTHSRRAKATFQQLKLNATVVAASEPRFDAALRLPYDRLMALAPLARELAGTIKYSLFGWF